MSRHTVYIGLGSNIGRRPLNLKRAIAILREATGITIEQVSSFYETSPIGPAQRSFVNAAARIMTNLEPKELLAALKRIEKEMGRTAGKRWGPRVIDLDILLYDNRVLRSKVLTLPHPRMHERLFVLVPLAEIAPKLVHPRIRKTMAALARELPLTHGKQKVRIFSKQRPGEL